MGSSCPLIPNMMKLKHYSTLFFLFICFVCPAQIVPKLVNYQAIAFDINGNPLNQESIDVKIAIFKGTSNNLLIYEEEHNLTTASNGLFSLQIGNGSTTGNGIISQFGNLDWNADDFFMNVQINIGNGYEDLGTQQLVSVPFAFRANRAEFVTNPGTFITNGTNITISGTGHSSSPYIISDNTLSTLATNNNGTFDYVNEAGLLTTVDFKSYINGGNNISVSGTGLISDPYLISGSFIELDDDPTNELITNFLINSSGDLELSDAGASYTIPLSWKKNGNNIFTNNSANYVGIGTTNPTEKLHILNGTIKIDNGFNPYKLPSSDGSANQYLKTDGSGNVTWVNIPTVTGPDNDWTINNNDIFNSNTGNVGIGTSNPGEKLSLSYDSYIGWEYSSTNGTYAHKIGKQPGFAKPLDFETSFNPGPTEPIFRFREMNQTGDVMTILYNGNIGIGTNSPSAKLDLVGTFQYEDGNSGFGKILTSDGDGNATWASNSIYTEFSNFNPAPTLHNDTWGTTNCTFTFNKQYVDSKIEIHFNSEISTGNFASCDGILFEVRVNGNSPDFDNHGFIRNSGAFQVVSIFAIFDSLTLGQHTVDLYAKTTNGTAFGVEINPDINATTDGRGKIIVKETF